MTTTHKVIESALTLVDSAATNIYIVARASNNLVLSDSALTPKKYISVASEIQLTSEGTHPDYNFTQVITQLFVTQEVTPTGTRNASCGNSLELVSTATSALRGYVTVGELELQHEVVARKPILLTAENDIANESANVDPGDIGTVDPNDPDAIEDLFANAGLRQTLGLVKVLNLTCISYLSPSQAAYRCIESEASNHIHLSHTMREVEYEHIQDRLYLSQSVEVHIVQDIYSTIEISQTVEHTLVLELTASSVLYPVSIVSYLLVDLNNYTPGIGDDDTGFTAPSPTSPTLTRRSTTVLTWPYSSPAMTLSLRNPEFDNVEQFESRRIVRRTRGGKLDFYRDENWPSAERLIMSFNNLTRTQSKNILTFLNKSLGQQIGLLDYESRQWRGIILTPASAVAERGRDVFSVSLQFEGELV